MKKLSQQIKAYEKRKDELEADYFGRWVIFHDEEFVGDYSDFQEAAQQAVEQFGRGPYLIRKVGEGPLQLPASLLYRPLHA